MSLKIPEPLKRAVRTTGFRLAAWHLAVFLAGGLCIMGLAYLMLSASLQKEDRAEIFTELGELATEYNGKGLDGLTAEIAEGRPSASGDWFFVRLETPDGAEKILSSFKNIPAFNLAQAGQPALKGEVRWDSLPAKHDETRLEVASIRLANGAVLQVGRDTADREDFLENFRSTAIAILFPTALIGLFGGIFLTNRTLHPLRQLVETVRTIESGKLNARVPVRNTGDELDEAGRLFNLMLERISLLVSGMRNALDNVAHDLRTPMTRLRAVAETALKPEQPEEARKEALSDCLEESDRVLALLNALMDISEAETGTMKLNLETIALKPLLAEVAELYSYPAEEKNIKIRVADTAEVELRCDKARLRQVTANLLDNAVKYTSEGGEVSLEAGREAGEVLIKVSDTGPGIPGHDLPKIWDRLYRGDSSRSEKGLGLGLSMVKAVTEAHGGRAEVFSAFGKGSIFTLRFPGR